MQTEPDGQLLEKEFKSVEFQFIRRFGKKPSLEAILLMIGYQESPEVKNSQNKEEKLDLINLGILTVLEKEGLFYRVSSDSGWPAFEPTDKVPAEDRETLVRRGIVRYFKENGI
jgi:hypothetical protein